MLNVLPMVSAHHTMRYEKKAIQRILPTNVMANSLRND